MCCSGLLRTSREPSGRAPEEEGDGAVEVEIQHPYPFNQSLPSSGESEEEEEEVEEEVEEGGDIEEKADDQEEEENGDIPATPWHPKPLGVSAETCWLPVAVCRKWFASAWKLILG